MKDIRGYEGLYAITEDGRVMYGMAQISISQIVRGIRWSHV